MTHKLSFAVILRRSSDSAPVQGAKFYNGASLLKPVEKPDGLYVFSDMPVCAVRVERAGLLPAQIEPEAGQCLSVCLYEGSGFVAPYGYRVTECAANLDELLYIESSGPTMRVTESANGMARLALRRGAPVGGWFLFRRADGLEEASFILEKKPPDTYYLLGHSGGFENGSAVRIYVGKADKNGVCRIVLPQDVPDAETHLMQNTNTNLPLKCLQKN